MFCKKVFIGRQSLRFLLTGGLFLLFLSSCASSSQYNKIAYCHNPDEQISNVKLQKYFNQIADELCGDECSDRRCAAESIMVPDFVDIQSVEAKKIGNLMGELMRSSLNKVCGYNIVQEKFSHLFKVSDTGLISLKTVPRDNVKSGNAPSSDKSSVLGTYSASADKLYIFAKIVNNSNGKITKMTSKEVTLSCD